MTTIKKLLTAEDLLALPDNGMKQELVRGELIEMPPPGVMHGIVVGNISWQIGAFVRQNNLGFVSTLEFGIYIERDPDTVRAADYNLISIERIAEPLPASGYVFGLVPDLVVEVISPGYRPPAVVEARTGMWLDAGVRLALVAHIATQDVVAHDDDGRVQRFEMGDTLTCEPVLPGFSCAVADIFAY